MELIFQNVQGRWIAEFELTADAAIHIEGVKEGDISLWQRSTASGKYAFVRDSRKTPTYGTVYDYEIPALITPKFIKVECMTEPTFAEVISSGEITELKFQDKTVEVTSNGTTTVTPDNGFAALNSVNVKVNVPQSGEGSGSASSWRYYDVSGMDKAYNTQVSAVMGVLVKVEGDSPITTIGVPLAMNTPILAIASDLSLKISGPNGELMTLKDVLITAGFTDELLAQWGAIEITEEEFYTL